jgi:hypothetical protein
MTRAQWEEDNAYGPRWNSQRCCDTCIYAKIVNQKLACVKLEYETKALRVNPEFVCKIFSWGKR